MKCLFLIAVLILVTPSYSTERINTLELQDTDLYTALNFVFAAGENPPHFIDQSAKTIHIDYFKLDKVEWDSAIRTLSNKYGFKIVRGYDRAWIVEPRK